MWNCPWELPLGNDLFIEKWPNILQFEVFVPQISDLPFCAE